MCRISLFSIPKIYFHKNCSKYRTITLLKCSKVSFPEAKKLLTVYFKNCYTIICSIIHRPVKLKFQQLSKFETKIENTVMYTVLDEPGTQMELKARALKSRDTIPLRTLLSSFL